MVIKIKLEDICRGDAKEERYYMQEIPEGEPLEIRTMTGYYFMVDANESIFIPELIAFEDLVWNKGDLDICGEYYEIKAPAKWMDSYKVARCLGMDEVVNISEYFTTENLSHLVAITYGEEDEKEIHGLKGDVYLMDKNGNTIDKY